MRNGNFRAGDEATKSHMEKECRGRDRESVLQDHRKMAAKAAFLLAGFEIQVS